MRRRLPWFVDRLFINRAFAHTHPAFFSSNDSQRGREDTVDGEEAVLCRCRWYVGGERRNSARHQRSHRSIRKHLIHLWLQMKKNERWFGRGLRYDLKERNMRQGGWECKLNHFTKNHTKYVLSGNTWKKNDMIDSISNNNFSLLPADLHILCLFGPVLSQEVYEWVNQCKEIGYNMNNQYIPSICNRLAKWVILVLWRYIFGILNQPWSSACSSFYPQTLYKLVMSPRLLLSKGLHNQLWSSTHSSSHPKTLYELVMSPQTLP